MERQATTNTDNLVGVITIAGGDVEGLYAEVDNPSNAGKTIFLERGIYVLSRFDQGGNERSHKGLLHLQPGMSLRGVVNDRSAVVIDTTSPTLDATVFGAANRVGTIRIGPGSHSIEWLTIRGNTRSAAGIATDLPGTGDLTIRVAHVISGDDSDPANRPADVEWTRGIDIRNLNTAGAGRTIDAVIEDCKFYGGRQGIRIANFTDTEKCKIIARMSGNHSYNNKTGCLMTNQKPSASGRGIIVVESVRDHFVNNGTGCVIVGVGGVGTGDSRDGNSVTFTATKSEMIDNNGVIDVPGPGGGIVASGADTSAADVASDNKVEIHLTDCKISGNQNADFAAFGARTFPSPSVGIAGRNNTVTIVLSGESAFNVDATNIGSNLVTVKREGETEGGVVPWP